MTAFQSLTQQGWHAYRYDHKPIEACPYPQSSQSAKDWRKGWDLAQKGQTWKEPLRRVKE